MTEGTGADLLGLPDTGKLTHNIAHFARALRRAGLPVGPGRILEAIRAVEAAGFTSRTDFYWTLHAVFVSRRTEMTVFAQVFRLFWRDPRFLEHMMSMLLPNIRGTQPETRADAAARRAAEALLDGTAPPPAPDAPDETGEEFEIDASGTASPEERLRSLDFEQMSPDEIAAAKAMIARLRVPVPPLLTRRNRRDPLGARPDWRATLRKAVARGGEVSSFARKSPAARWPDLVAICDISGSMSQYSRMVLHFLHAVSNAQGQGWARVHAFTFGTRLTNITRHLRTRDVDTALAAAGAEAQDWDGGTRIAECLHTFNRDWSRRVMSRGATVILITDGLDRGAPGGADIAAETRRLRLSARRLVWINPLLRWDGFTPRAAGIAAMLPQVDALVPGHSVATLAALGTALSAAAGGGDKDRLQGGNRRPSR
ncbi:MAG: vWA domain-containing protein [Paracoccaceae bacterium]